MTNLKPVDHTALRTNQATIIILLILGYILNQPLFVVLVALFMLGGTLLGRPGFGWLYQGVLKPLRVLEPEVLQDNPAPHRFAQGFGGSVVAAAAVALFAGAPTLGWILAWIVVGLAALNLFLGFCAGCAVYYLLNRLGVPGFTQPPPPDTRPGFRPPRQTQ